MATPILLDDSLTEQELLDTMREQKVRMVPVTEIREGMTVTFIEWDDWRDELDLLHLDALVWTARVLDVHEPVYNNRSETLFVTTAGNIWQDNSRVLAVEP
jgi:hypothetical protein